MNLIQELEKEQYDKLAAGKEMPLTSFADAARTHEVIFAADKSAELGRPVKCQR